MTSLCIRVYRFNKEKTKRKLIDQRTWETDKKTEEVFLSAKEVLSCSFDDCCYEIELDKMLESEEETISSFYITSNSYNSISKE